MTGRTGINHAMHALPWRFWMIRLAVILPALGGVTAPAQDSPDQPADMREIMQRGKPPMPIRREAPVYPQAMKQSGLNGTVMVSFIVDAKGMVKNARVVKSSNPGFEAAAIDALLGWKFAPAQLDGHPVGTRISQIIEFKLPGGGPGEIGAAGKSQSKPPRAVKQVTPTFPYAMKRTGQAGRVKLSFVVNEQGNVTEVHVIGSNNPWYERPAVDALLKWKYSPAEKDGHPVSMRAEQEIIFAVDDSREEYWTITKGRDHEKQEPEYRWDKPPEVINSAFPVYPFEALRGRVAGKARIAFVVGPDGAVRQSLVEEATTPEMGLAALAAVETWRFSPARKKDGTPCLAKLAREQDFTMDKYSDAPVSASARDILRLLEKHPEQIVPATALDQPPKTRWARAPQPPLAPQSPGEPGEALVELFIDERGDVQMPSVVTSSRPEFGYAAVQAVATWQFEPPMKDGKPAVTRVRVPFKF
jgi:TonB family protein